MEQRTCNIIMLCKRKQNKYNNGDTTYVNVIAKYMGDVCRYPWELYDYRQMENILLTALYDYIDGADKPSVELRVAFANDRFASHSLLERICTMFMMTDVMDKGEYVNGFTQELLDKAYEILGIEND